MGGQALESIEGDCCKVRRMCGLGVSTPEGSGQGRTEGMPEARGRHGDAAGPEGEGMMPVLEVALGHQGKTRTEGRTSSTWTPDARPRTRSTSAAAATVG